MQKPEKYGKSFPNSLPVKEKDWSYAHSFIIFGFFAGLALMAIFSIRTLIPLMDLSKILAACLFTGMLLPKKWYRKWFGFNIYEVILFNLLGVGPFLCGLLLTVNFIFTTNTYTEHRPIIMKKVTSNIGGTKVLYHLEGGAYKEFSRVRKFDLKDYEKMKKAEYIKYTFADGCLGYKVMKGYEIE